MSFSQTALSAVPSNFPRAQMEAAIDKHLRKSLGEDIPDAVLLGDFSQPRRWGKAFTEKRDDGPKGYLVRLDDIHLVLTEGYYNPGFDLPFYICYAYRLKNGRWRVIDTYIDSLYGLGLVMDRTNQ